MVRQFRKKPVVISAIRLERSPESLEAVLAFLDAQAADVVHDEKAESHAVQIHTLEGTHLAQVGDYIIRGVAGEFYPCKPDIFEATYDVVPSGADTSMPPQACEGANCHASAANDYTHSAECLEETSLLQGWADFSTALRALKAGKRVARRGWIEEGMWLSGPSTAETASGVVLRGWIASEADMLAEDWIALED